MNFFHYLLILGGGGVGGGGGGGGGGVKKVTKRKKAYHQLKMFVSNFDRAIYFTWRLTDIVAVLALRRLW